MKRGAIAIVVMLLFLGCERSDIDEKSLKLASFESHTLYMILESLNEHLVSENRPTLKEENIIPKLNELLAKKISEELTESEKDNLILLFESDAYTYIVGLANGTEYRTKEKDEVYLPELKRLEYKFYMGRWRDLLEKYADTMTTTFLVQYAVQTMQDEIKK